MAMKYAISQNLLLPEEGIEIWESSIFKNLKPMGPKQFGKRNEEITSEQFKMRGCIVEKSKGTIKYKNSEYDREIDGVLCEMKGSRISKDGAREIFTLNQFRPHQIAARYILTCYHPNKITIWILSKESVIVNINAGIIIPQHGGKAAVTEKSTYMYTGDPSKLLGIELYLSETTN